MITSIDEEKAFNKIQHHFMLTAPSKVGIEGIFYTTTKAIYEKCNASMMLHRESL